LTVKCPKCQTENPDTKQFCADCGTQLPSSKDIRPDVTETIQTPVKQLATGAIFAGRYQIIEELGHGGMGRVYKVHDTKIGEKIALKLIRPEALLDKKTVERFSNELKLARKIRHKNICQMFDLGEDQGTRYITMEYIHGEDLKQLIRKVGRLSPGQAIGIARQVCGGLEEAHKLGVVHRDLKPQNIMIDEDGNARIMDFGIARSLTGKGITGAGVMIGTPEYMSPEQVEGKETDQRSDIYSLGVILYEMATGRVPFEGDTPFTIGIKHKSEPPKDPRALNAQLPQDLSRLILRCLEKDKNARYQTAAEVGTELEKIGKGIPTTDRVVPVRKTLTSREITVKFRPIKVILPALAVVAVIAAAIVFWPKKASNLDPKLVAVAVFENKTGDPKLDNIGSLAAERIIQGLTQVGQFSIAPMPSAEALSASSKGQDRLRALAEATKAGKIVHGDYYVQGETIQFHAWVQDMAAKKNILAFEPASGSVKDPAAALEPLRLKLMGGLAGVFDPGMKDSFSMLKEPPNFEAYREYTEGTKSFSRGEYPKAIEHLLRAAERDPNLRMALIRAAVAYYNQGQYAKADELAQKVEKSRADLSSGERILLDWLQGLLHGDNEIQLRSVRQIRIISKAQTWTYLIGLDGIRNNYPRESLDALARYDPYNEAWKDWSPNYWGVMATAHHMLGNYKQELKEAHRGRKQFPERISMLAHEADAVAALGRTKDLQKLFDESRTLPPQSGYSPENIMLRAGRELRAHGYKEDSIRVLNQALQWFETRPSEERISVGNRYDEAMTFYVLGKWAEAKGLFNGLHGDVPDNIDYFGYLGAVAVQSGDKEGALKISKELEEDKRPYLFGNPTYWRARIAALLGDKEGAVGLLRQAIKQGYAYSNIHPTEDFESLADFPPYIQLMKPKG
jgi:tetratricopeptide (TPR) repeat protein/tRNA A-37 threonylcarbamoyl transferase component Bud32